MKYILLIAFICAIETAYAQKEFPFGKVSHQELDLKQFAADTSANALVLAEQGDSYIDIAQNRLVFQYYVKIKILKRNG